MKYAYSRSPLEKSEKKEAFLHKNCPSICAIWDIWSLPPYFFDELMMYLFPPQEGAPPY